MISFSSFIQLTPLLLIILSPYKIFSWGGVAFDVSHQSILLLKTFVTDNLYGTLQVMLL